MFKTIQLLFSDDMEYTFNCRIIRNWDAYSIIVDLFAINQNPSNTSHLAPLKSIISHMTCRLYPI